MNSNQATPPAPVRIALAGLSHDHVFWLLRHLKRPDVVVVGIWETDRALAARYAAQFGLAPELIYPDLAAMLDAVKPAAVAAFGPVFDHLKVVEACAPRHIQVMVEKPLAVSPEHAGRMAKLAHAHGIHLLTNYETTWYANTYAAQQAVVAGSLGPVRKVVVHAGHWGPVELGCTPEFLGWLTDPILNGGGALIDFGCYGANLITWLLGGQAPLTVTAVLQTLKPAVYPKVDDDATIILTYPQAQGIIQASWNWPVGRKDMEIYGATGSLVTVGRDTVQIVRRGEKGCPNHEETLRLPPTPEPVNDPFAYLAAVVRGDERVTPGNLWSIENNLLVVRILDAARLSARTGQTVKFS